MVFQIILSFGVYSILLFTTVSPISLRIERDSTDDEICNTDACKEAATLLLASINKSIDPCENFFDYTCSGWIKNNPIPPSEDTYTTMHLLLEEIFQQVKDVLTNPPVKPTASKAVINAQNLYQGCLNTDSRQNQGVQPVKDLLNEFGGWPILNSENWDSNSYSWSDFVPRIIRKLGLDPLLALKVDADDKNANGYIIYLDQPEFTPGRNQLINMTENDKTIELITAYKQYITTASKLLGTTSNEDAIKQNVESIVNFESELAKLSRSNEDRRDIDSLYNKMTVSKLQQDSGDSINWKTFLNVVLNGFTPADDSTEVVVQEVDYLKRMIELVKGTDIKTLANFIGWKIVEGMGRHSTNEFRDARFRFEKVQYGTEAPQELYKTCYIDIVDLLGFAVGRVYIDKYFAGNAKQDVDTMVNMLKTTYRESLTSINWMDEETKTRALEKLSAVVSMMGYPEWITNDAKLDEYYVDVPTLNKDTYFLSFVKTKSAKTAKDIKRWDKKRDKTEWITTPAVLNAFYSPNANSISFPAAILNAPFYKYDRLPSMNYGAIGMVVGHEISHGFDDMGSKYDKDGNLQDWWTNTTRESFDKKAQCFRDQYSSYVEPTTGLHLNGNNTIGENIADNGAIRNAFKAYRKYVEQSDTVPRRLPGLNATSDQLFFLSYAYMWCGVQRKESLEVAIQYFPHTPNKYRVIVPLTNSEDFARAFNCSSGTAMNPVDKCILW